MNVVYKLTSPNGKSYIGQTTRGFERRMREHEYNALLGRPELVYVMIREHGWDNFTKEILMLCGHECELNEWETICISAYNTIYPNGYNIQRGGNGVRPETRQKMSESAKLRAPPPPAERKNGLDQNLPTYVQYVPKRNGYKIEGHPNCKTRAFYSTKLTLEEKKEQCLDFLEQLDNGMKVIPRPAKELPRYIYEVKNGYSIHIKNKTIKTFQKKSNTMEQNLRLTIDYLGTYLHENKL